ncbi:MAG: hypothetical protein MHM6MM_002088 [Cercozoa sp. M6MM]
MRGHGIPGHPRASQGIVGFGISSWVHEYAHHPDQRFLLIEPDFQLTTFCRWPGWLGIKAWITSDRPGYVSQFFPRQRHPLGPYSIILHLATRAWRTGSSLVTHTARPTMSAEDVQQLLRRLESVAATIPSPPSEAVVPLPPPNVVQPVNTASNVTTSNVTTATTLAGDNNEAGKNTAPVIAMTADAQMRGSVSAVPPEAGMPISQMLNVRADAEARASPGASGMQKKEPIRLPDGKWKCPYCGKCIKQRSNMTVHLRIHTGERPFKCAVCAHRFAHSSNLKKHEKLHLKGNETVKRRKKSTPSKAPVAAALSMSLPMANASATMPQMSLVSSVDSTRRNCPVPHCPFATESHVDFCQHLDRHVDAAAQQLLFAGTHSTQLESNSQLSTAFVEIEKLTQNMALVMPPETAKQFVDSRVRAQVNAFLQRANLLQGMSNEIALGLNFSALPQSFGDNGLSRAPSESVNVPNGSLPSVLQPLQPNTPVQTPVVLRLAHEIPADPSSVPVARSATVQRPILASVVSTPSPTTPVTAALGGFPMGTLGANLGSLGNLNIGSLPLGSLTSLGSPSLGSLSGSLSLDATLLNSLAHAQPQTQQLDTSRSLNQQRQQQQQ